MTESNVHDELPRQDQTARAIFENRLQPGERLIWADRGAPYKLALYYIGIPLIYAAVMFVFTFSFFVIVILIHENVYSVYQAAHAVSSVSLFMASFIFISIAIGRQSWRSLFLNSHYYALTDRRLLRSIGGGKPRRYKHEKIVWLKAEGPSYEGARGDIQFYWDAGQDHQPYFRIRAIQEPYTVASLIKAHLPIRISE